MPDYLEDLFIKKKFTILFLFNFLTKIITRWVEWGKLF